MEARRLYIRTLEEEVGHRWAELHCAQAVRDAWQLAMSRLHTTAAAAAAAEAQDPDGVCSPANDR